MRRIKTLWANSRDTYKRLSFTSTKDLSAELLRVYVYLVGDPSTEIDVTAEALPGVAAGQVNTVAVNLADNQVPPGVYFMVVRDSAEQVNKSVLFVAGPDAHTLRDFDPADPPQVFVLIDDEGNVLVDDEGNVLTT